MTRMAPNAYAGASLLLDRGVRDQLRLGWRLVQDKRVTSFKYALPGLVAFYVASPVDAIPDFLLGLGQLDDVGIVIAAILLFTRMLPRLAPGYVVQEHLEAMRNSHEAASPAMQTDEAIIDAHFTLRGER